ncbi:response regulator [Candidatus Sulfurimonas marisnigri]|uniref:Response regulator n=1 Tax=Candidatus Sulfurimonas marisnigri TaxID=2740405 RepID=A0A7S7RQR0_9BACT|nr:HD domain-containing phosphohydrolase [Candidatus Sulfurimonas marisnigri]QOY54823.1 response regulator [Candidatus Sulfurimonas marisnigri]
MVNAKELKEITKNLTLLYVEDEDDLRVSVEGYLSKLFAKVVCATNGREGLDYYKNGQYDIVMTDIQMPLMDGLEMSKKIKEINPNQEIIITSAYGETIYFLESIRIGVNGYIIKPIDYMQMNQELYKSTLKLVSFKENVNYKLHLEDMVTERTEKILAMEDERTRNFENTILSFVEMIEDRDTYTGGHSQRVASYAKLIAKEMGQSDEDCELLYVAGMMHDIGKIATPDTILLKPGKLNDIEYELIKEHATVGYELLNKIPMYKKHAEIVRHHHERYDGKGYPQGLAGEEIPLLSHILLVADAFDSMTTNRIYKGRKNIDKAVEELDTFSGMQFHPDVVKSAIKVLSKIDIDTLITQLPQTEIEKERFSYFFRDQITDAYNKQYLDFILERNILKEYVCVNKLYLHNFNQYNQKNSWEEGDVFLNKFVTYLHKSYPLSTVFRVNGDDFVLMNKEHIEIDVKEFEALDFIQNANVNISVMHFDLRKKNISNKRELEEALLKAEQDD